MPSTSSSAPPEPAPRRRRGLLLAAAAVVVLVVAGVTAFAVASAGDSGSSGSSSSSASEGSGNTKPFVDTSATAQVGQAAPDFTLRTLDGKRVSLASLRGRPVILNFWASWCNPCRHEFPQLQATLQKYRADKLAVVGISFEDIDSDARQFAKQQHATWPLAVDVNGAAAKAYDVRYVPTTYFITPDGVVADQVFGQLPTGTDFQTSLSKILQAHALGA